jgi:chromosome segregation ATPase
MGKGGDVIFERLDLLEGRVRATLAELHELRTARETLEASLRATEASLAERDQELAALRAERETAQGRVEAMLEAIEEAKVADRREPAAARRGGDNGQARAHGRAG